MKTLVEYNESEQTQNLNGPFVFVNENGVIRNLEAKW